MSRKPKKIRAGAYEHMGVHILKFSFGWQVQGPLPNWLDVGDTEYLRAPAKTLREIARRLDAHPVETRNLLNPEAGPIKISAADRGGCCDPGTETYWSM